MARLGSSPIVIAVLPIIYDFMYLRTTYVLFIASL
jgi:hypothetical protein